jgi:hypothetical protein
MWLVVGENSGNQTRSEEKVFLAFFMCKTGYLGSLEYQIRLFLSLGCFEGWFSHDVAATQYIRSLNYEKCLFFVPQLSKLFIFPLTVLEGDICMMWHWVNIGTCRGGTPWCHPYPERRSSRVVVQRRRARAVEKDDRNCGGSCDGACRAIRHDGLVWQSGSCGRARGEKKKEATWHVRPTITCTSHVGLIITLCENHPLKQPRDPK